MKRMTIFRALLFLIPFFAVGCDNSPSNTSKESQVTASEVRESLEEGMETTGEFLDQKDDEFQSKIETQLQALESKHTELMAHAGKVGNEANAELQETLDDLDKKKKNISGENGSPAEFYWASLGGFENRY